MVKLYNVIIIYFILSFFSIPFYGQSDSSYNLLWKIEKEGVSNKGYLFGTMHVLDERAFGFADSVMLALEECDIFALEIHPDSLIKSTLEFMLNVDTINYFKDNLTEYEYELFLEDFSKENSIDFEEIENKHPLNVKTFDHAYKGKADKTSIVDLHLFGIAKTLDKKIIGLESIDNHLKALFDRTLKRARFRIKSDSIFEKMFLNQLIKSYNKGNLDGMENIFGNDFANTPIMINRNKDMVESIIHTLNEKSLFSAVGAAHLMGDSSIISLLNTRGYKVSQVVSTFTGVADKYIIDPENIPWQFLVDIFGGFQINFPRDFTILDQSIPYKSELGMDTIDIKIKMYADLIGMQNFLISYTDFPIGYYLESRELIYEAIEEELIGQGNAIDSFEDIDHNGNIGRLYRILSPGNYYANLHVFVRGNRIYRFINQNLTPGKKVDDESTLINSLKLLPYAKSKIKQKKVQDFQLPYFNRGFVKLDSAVDHNSYFKNGFIWYADDPATGNTLSLSVYGLKELLSIGDLDSFYADYIDLLVSWNDSIISSKSIFEDSLHGHELLIVNQSKEAFTRFRLWFFDNQAIIYAIYSDSIGVFCDNSDAFITAKILDDPLSQKTLLEDKTKKVMSLIYDPDSLVASAALDALLYNTFDSSYADQLETLFLTEYMKDTLHADQNEAIMDLLFKLPTFDPRKMSHAIANNLQAPDEMRACSILKLFELGDTLKAIELLFNKVPTHKGYSWNVFSPFEASNKLSYENLESLVVSLKYKEYRNTILRLIINVAKNNNPDYKKKIKQNYNKITAYFEYKIDTSLKVTSVDIATYTDFFGSIEDNRNLEYIEKIDTTELPLHVLSSLTLARIYNNMIIEPKMINNLLLNKYYKFDIQKALIQEGKLDVLPDSLRSATSIYTSKIENYLEENDYDNSEIELLGSINDETQSNYHVYKITETYEGENYCYLGIVKNTNMKGRLIFNDIRATTKYLDVCDFSNWKKIAKIELKNFNDDTF